MSDHVTFLPTRATRSGERAKDSWGFFKVAQGFGRLDAGSRAGFTSSRPPPPWTSVIPIFFISVRCVILRNLDLLIKTDWSVICPLCC